MKRKVQLVLREDVQHLGQQGDVVNVPLGYAKNFLLPRNLARRATDAALVQAAEVQKLRKQKELQQQEQLSSLAATLNGQHLSIRRKTTEKGTLYEGIRASDVCTLLQNKGLQGVEPSMVQLKKPITELGEFPVSIQLTKDTTVTLTVAVEAEQSS